MELGGQHFVMNRGVSLMDVFLSFFMSRPTNFEPHERMGPKLLDREVAQFIFKALITNPRHNLKNPEKSLTVSALEGKRLSTGSSRQ
jgi:hypothetical protein